MNDVSKSPSPSRAANITLWIIQGVLAAMFLFSGVSKFLMPVEEMTKGTGFSGGFIHFIGAAEILGALGLILPLLLRIKPALTPVAAVGLFIIMVGAVVTTVRMGAAPMAVMPAVFAALLLVVAWKRGTWVTRGRAAGAL
ncbi:MAG: DoxX family protein [Deltaproteobacteria bacterium]|nr:DoxX family protein [Deltaproteobacteria bacterium]